MRIGIIAALPGELKQIVRRTGFRRVPATAKTLQIWTCSSDMDVWVAVCAGMGAGAARRAFAEAERDGVLDRVLSIGWAGALDDAVNAGCSYIPSAVVDAQTGERFDLAGGQRSMTLVSTARVAQEPEKRRLAATYAAAMVDMEAATVVRMAQQRGIQVACVKAISDEVGAALPDFNPFINPDGQMRLLPFVAHAAVRPRTWRPLIRLGRTSTAAAHSLASAVFAILTGPKDFSKIDQGGDVEW